MLFVLGIIPFQGLRPGDCDCDCSWGDAPEGSSAWAVRQRGYANAVQAYAAIEGPIVLIDPSTQDRLALQIDDELSRREHGFAEEGDRAFVCYRVLANIVQASGVGEEVAAGACFPLTRKEDEVWLVDGAPVLLGRKPRTAGGTDDMEAFVRFRCPKHWMVQSHEAGSCHLCGAPLAPASPSASPSATL